MDTKRKGIKLWCYTCKANTRHIPEVDHHEKMAWWICEQCGASRLFDKWS